MREYNQPILCTIFRILGFLSLIGAAIFLIVGLYASASGNSGAGITGGIIGMISCIASAIIDFGFAELISLIGQIAHNTYRTSVTQEGVLMELESARKHLRDSVKTEDSKNRRIAPLSTEQQAFLFQNGETVGPFAISKLKAMKQTRKIHSSAKFCFEDAKDWLDHDEFFFIVEGDIR